MVVTRECGMKDVTIERLPDRVVRHFESRAGNSCHMHGRAADITLPDYTLAGLRRRALSLEAGGVGYHPRSDFVHVDTGPVRNW